MLLVWALAFLQCLVPLLHAHAGGLHVSGDAHIHLDALNVGAPQTRTEFHVDLCDSPAVSAPSEFRRDPLFSGGDFVAVVKPIPQAAILAAARMQFLPASRYPAFHKPTPPAQAPPTVSRFL